MSQAWAVLARLPMFGMRCAALATLAVAVAYAAAGCSAGAEPSTPIDECLGTSSAAVKVCAAGPTLHGIDVSYYQGNVDWAKVKADGQSFAFARVSDGVDYPDAKFSQNWPAMKKAGLVRGLYQFFRPTKDVTAQVNLLSTKLAAAGGLEPGDLPPVLDLESDGGLPASTVVARAKEWLAQVEATYGVKPIIYTPAYMSDVTGNSFSGYVLWVPNYKTTCPSIPTGWTNWSFWQHSDSGTVSGIASKVDTNFFNGTLSELNALTLKPEATKTVPTTVDTTDAIAEDESFASYQGETIGSSGPASAPEAPQAPCR